MDAYERLINSAEFIGLEVTEKKFRSSAKGLCKGNRIGISKNIETKTEKRCVLAEEIAHSCYTSGNILDTRDIMNAKQETFARSKAYEMLIPFNDLVSAYNSGCESCYAMAEYLEVTEGFLIQTINHYENKYGTSIQQGKYIVNFSPFYIKEGKVNYA